MAKMNPKDFIAFAAPYAVDTYRKHKIWPSITIAQAAGESGWGGSAIGYNLFGVKAFDDWKKAGGKWQTVPTYEEENGVKNKYNLDFRDYNSFDESFADHAKVLLHSRYDRVRSAPNYKVAARELYNCGYATSSDYPELITGIIEHNKLYEYDKKVSGDPNFRPEDAPIPPISHFGGVEKGGKVYNYLTENYEESDMVDTSKMVLPKIEDFYLSEVEMKGAKSKLTTNTSEDIVGKRSHRMFSATKQQDNKTSTSSNKKSPLRYCIDDHIDFGSLGYNDTEAYFLLKAKPILTNDAISLNQVDGDTVKFYMDSIKGDSPFKKGGVSYSAPAFQNYVKANIPLYAYQNNDFDFSVRVLGIDAPEIPHYSKVRLENYREIDYEIRKFKYKDIALSSNFIFEKKQYNPDDEIAFIRFKDKDANDSKMWNQYFPDKGLTLSSDESEPSTIGDGYRARDILVDMLKNSNETYIMLDAASLNSDGAKNASRYKARGQSEISYAYSKFLDYMFGNNAFKFLGFNAFGQDLYKRFLGAIYVNVDKNKLPKKWQDEVVGNTVTINLAKYLIANVDLEVLPSFNTQPVKVANNNFVSDAFRLPTYNFKNTDDLFDEISAQLDDRDKIQSEMFNMSQDKLRDWTVSIGDTTMFIPPTSIRTISESTSERTPLIRAKGGITKSSPKSKKSLELTLYFNDDHGINGLPYTETLPNGQEITYYMNGLRSLISQFKLTPFLPIENTYINDTLGIEAVTLSNLQITTMPNYPKCISATLLLEEFNYRVYMPELVVDKDPEVFANTNYFSKSINFPTMRWYYQRPLINGSKILNYNLNNANIYPEQLLKDTMGNKTMLAPMTHQDSKVLFYVPDEELLKQRLQIKMEASKKSITNTFKHSTESKSFISDMAKVYNKVNQVFANSTGRLNLKDIKDITNDLKTLGPINDAVIKDKLLQGGYDVQISLAQSMSSSELDRMKEYVLGGQEGKASDYYKNEKINLAVKKDGDKYRLDKTSPDYTFLSICSQLSVNDDQINDIQDNIDKNKDSIDIESYESLRFLKYDIEDVSVANISCSYQNVLSEISLNGIDGYAPQYMGGQDTVIDIMFQTSNESAVAQLYALPEMVADQISKYREVLTSWPLRISSDITNLLGVYEVVVDSVQADTIPNQPGVYNVQMRLISVDRTLRNRDALMKIDGINNEGYQGLSSIPYKDLQTYFDFNKAISKVEVYPDLELPTIDEVESTGLLYVRNKNQPDQAYVDPDFYFIYSHALFSEMVRDGVVEYFKDYDRAAKRQFLNDGFGASASLDFDSDTHIYTVRGTNEVYDQQLKQIDEFKSLRESEPPEDEISTKDNELMEDLDKVAQKVSWNIAKEVNIPLLDTAAVNQINSKTNNPFKKDHKESEVAARKVLRYLKNNPVRGKGPSSKELSAYEGKSGAKWTVTSPGNTVRSLLKDMGVSASDIDLDVSTLSTMIVAAHSATSAEREYNKGDSNSASLGRTFYDSAGTVPVGIVSGGSQDFSGMRRPTSIKDQVDNGLSVGPYGIRYHTLSEVKSLTGAGYKNTKKSKYLLDPYYTDMAANDERLFDYALLSTVNSSFSERAFVRMCLYWQARMILDKIAPAIKSHYQKEAVDNLNDPAITKLLNAMTGGRLESLSEGHSDQKAAKAFKKAFNETEKTYKQGKNFLPVLVALTNGDTGIYSLLKSKNHTQLNQYKEAALSGEQSLSDDTTALPTSTDILFRRYVMALMRGGVIKNIESIRMETPNVGNLVGEYMQEKLYLEAADDPSQYILHSFIDMISTDKRGRMLRAFPTFYMCFIDEGYKNGVWKLTDNFYDYSAISEIQIVKSRKIAADTAKITMANTFNTLTSEDEDVRENYQYNFKDVFQSKLYPYKDYQKRKALQEEFSSVEKAKINPGARVHIRMGYGSNAAELPVAFNGSIAEVANGPFVTIVAQGDGVELVNPIMSQKDAEEINNNDKFLGWIPNLFVQSNTPKAILTSILSSKGGFMNKKVVELTDGRFGNQNPFGISHFGNPDNKEIFLNSEVSQNIYEGSASSPWNTNDSVASLYSTPEAPKLSFGMFGKTVWDVLHMCGATSPDYLVGIVPFGLRSSIFHGAPHYYCAYDYFRADGDGTLYEKRKPYQQFHLYTSYSDIISNGIYVTGKDMKTAAIGTYTRGDSESSNQQTVGPLWADFMIYPEKQTTMICNTDLLYKGGGKLLNLFWINNLMDNFADDTGKVQSGYKISWRMTANELKDSMKDMYQGELLVLGDPSVKPNDRMFISDTYENMNGPCLVESVVHTMSAEMGYTTSMTPDIIAVVDDRRELELQNMAGKALATPVSAYYATTALTSAACGWAQPFLKLGTKSAKGLNKSNLYKFGKATTGSIGSFMSGVKGGSTVLGALETAKAGITASFTAGSAVAMGLEFGLVFIATETIAEAVERKMQNYRVLQVFPLKKNGMPYTAGLNGSKGMVFGSPSFEDAGFIGDIFDTMFIKHPDDPFIVNALKTVFTTNNMQRIAMSYQKNNGIANQDGGALHEIATSGVGEALLNSEINNQAAADDMAKFKNANVPAQKLTSHICIYDSSILRNLKERGKFTTLHESGRGGLNIVTKQYTINNQKRDVPTIVYNDKKVYDLEMVNKQLLSPLEVITLEVTNNNKNADVILTSGLQLDTSIGKASDSCMVVVRGAKSNEVENLMKDIESRYEVRCTRQQKSEMEAGSICILLRTKSTTKS